MCVCVNTSVGIAIGEVVNCWLLVMDAWVLTKVSLCGICCGQHDTGPGFGFLRVLLFSPVIIFIAASYSFLFQWGVGQRAC
jgi:lactam utilization protein B